MRVGRIEERGEERSAREDKKKKEGKNKEERGRGCEQWKGGKKGGWRRVCNSTQGKRCARERLAALFVASLPAVNCQQQKRSTFGQRYILLPYVLATLLSSSSRSPSLPRRPCRHRRDGNARL